MHEFRVFADYHQFCLMDAGEAPRIPETVTEQDMHRRLRMAPHIVVFQTESAMHVPVQIAFVPAPTEATGSWEHSAEFSLSLPSGNAVLCGCTDLPSECPRIVVTPAIYSGRAYFAGQGVGEERYCVVLWPAAQPGASADDLRPRLG